MTGSRLLRATLFCAALLCTLAAASSLAEPAAQPSVSLSPSIVQPGSPELIRVLAPGSTSVTGDWLGHTLTFFPGIDRSSWFALAGADVAAPAGPSTLRVTITLTSGETRALTLPVDLKPAHYRTTTLTVPPRFVEPSPAELQRIQEEKELKARIFAASAPQPLWHGNFRPPMRAALTDSFGTRRLVNGELNSIHKGSDFRARTGTPVRAANAGTVVLARGLYFEGNCVVIDHGLGLYTLSMHLSRIRVHEGQHVAAGQLLGLSGATGRVTGPHLHWAVRWQDAYLDPAKFLRLNLTRAH